nr:transcription initiation factor IIF subunit beta [Ipomoea batatas]
MEKVLVVNDGSINAGLLSFIKSKFEVEERNPSQALETLRMMSRGGVGGFDIVISYSHKRQSETTELNTFIEREFPQQLPIVYVTATTVLSGMSAMERRLDLTREQVNSHLQKYRNFIRNQGSPSRRKNKLANHFEEYQKFKSGRCDESSMDKAIAAKMLFAIDTGFNDYSLSQNPKNMPMQVEGLSYPMNQNHNPPFGVIENNNSGGNYMDQLNSYQCPSTQVEGFSYPMIRNHNPPFGVIENNNSGVNYMDQLNSYQCPSTQVEGSSYPMSQNHNPPFGVIENNNSGDNYMDQLNSYQCPSTQVEGFSYPMSQNHNPHFGVIENNISYSNYMDQLNSYQCPSTQVERLSYPMSQNHNPDIGINDYSLNQNLNMPMPVEGLSYPMSQNHNPPFGVIENNNLGGNYMDQLNSYQCLSTQVDGLSYPMSRNHNPPFGVIENNNLGGNYMDQLNSYQCPSTQNSDISVVKIGAKQKKIKQSDNTVEEEMEEDDGNCPLVVSKSWQSQAAAAASSSDTPLVGKVVVSLDPLKPEESLQFSMEMAGNDAGNMNIPKGYSLNMFKDFVPMCIFSESNQAKVAMEGRIEHKFDMKPHTRNMEEYRKMCRERTNKSMIKNRQIQIIDNDRGVHMRSMPGMLGLIASGSKEKKKATPVKGPEVKRTRRDRGELEDIMFKLFERQPNWTLKQLVQETDQPAQFLKEILNELCVYNKRGANQGTYELKPEYKKSAEDTGAD